MQDFFVLIAIGRGRFAQHPEQNYFTDTQEHFLSLIKLETVLQTFFHDFTRILISRVALFAWHRLLVLPDGKNHGKIAKITEHLCAQQYAAANRVRFRSSRDLHLAGRSAKSRNNAGICKHRDLLVYFSGNNPWRFQSGTADENYCVSSSENRGILASSTSRTVSRN